MRVANGGTRVVFIFDKIVLKIPTYKRGIFMFLSGWCINYKEYKNYKKYKYDWLAPVTNCFLFGLVILMKKAGSEVKPSDVVLFSMLHKEVYIFTEDLHIENLKRLNGKMVIIDYGENSKLGKKFSRISEQF